MSRGKILNPKMILMAVPTICANLSQTKPCWIPAGPSCHWQAVVWPTTCSHSIQVLVRLSQWRHQNYLVRFRKRPLKVPTSNFLYSREVLWMKHLTHLNLSSSSYNISPWGLSLFSPSCTAPSCTWVLLTPQWGKLWSSGSQGPLNILVGGTG